jgi:hypothetical protein
MYDPLQPLVNYPPAEKFCSRKYAIKTVTVFVRALAKSSPTPVAKANIPQEKQWEK